MWLAGGMHVASWACMCLGPCMWLGRACGLGHAEALEGGGGGGGMSQLTEYVATHYFLEGNHDIKNYAAMCLWEITGF